MYSLPTTVKIRDKEFPIRNKGDFRVILDCFEALQDPELTKEERIISSLFIFYADANVYTDVYSLFNENTLEQAVSEMFNFINCGQDDIGSNQHYKVIDWTKDAQMIMSGINNVAGKEVRAEEYVHWWTFMGYFMAIGESTLSTVVGIRTKIAKGKKLEKYEQEFKRDNPNYFMIDYRTVEDINEEEMLRALWEGGN